MTESEYHPLYLKGIEEFNRHRYFDSHEVWEDLWIGETGPARPFYKGMIQAAVALHHLARGNVHGANKLLQGSQRHLGPFRPWYLGLDVEGFLAAMRHFFDDALAGQSNRVRAPEPEIRLCPPPDDNERRPQAGRRRSV